MKMWGEGWGNLQAPIDDSDKSGSIAVRTVAPLKNHFQERAGTEVFN
jgi:hypothetical protein